MTQQLRAAAAAAVAAMVLATTGCGGSGSSAAPTAPAGSGSVAASPTGNTGNTGNTSATGGSGGGAGAWCDIVISSNTRLGIMVDKHYIPATEITLDDLVAMTDEALAGASEYLAAAPPEIRSAVQIQLAYFQDLKDHNFDVTGMTLPDGFLEAIEALNTFQEEQCGITFD